METNELILLLRNRLSISITTDTESESGGEYASISIELLFNDDEGESHIISRDYDSICINRYN